MNLIKHFINLLRQAWDNRSRSTWSCTKEEIPNKAKILMRQAVGGVSGPIPPPAKKEKG